MAYKRHALAAMLLAIAATAVAHVGHLHDYPEGDPVANDWSNVEVASCSSWTALPTAISKASLTTPVEGRRDRRLHATPAGNLTVNAADLSAKGTAEVVVYLFDDCKGVVMAGIRANLTITDSGKPANNVSITGLGQTGTCSSGGGDVYNFNASMPNEDENQLLFSKKRTAVNGTIIGTAGVDHDNLKSGGQSGVKSIVLYYNGTAFSCCNLKIANSGSNYSAPLAKKGKDCPDMADAMMHDSTGTKGGTMNMTSMNSTNTDQIGMIMNGEWMPCTMVVNGTYVMNHSGTIVQCKEYKNGTIASSSATSSTNKTSSHHNGAPAANSGNVAMLAAAAFMGMLLLV